MPGPPKSPPGRLSLAGSRLASDRGAPAIDTSAPPARPEWLAGRARELWDEQAPPLFRAGLLTVLDGPLYARYCDTWARYLDAREQLDNAGLLAKGAKGNAVKHPALVVYRQLGDDLLKMERDLGLTPATRGRVDARPPSAAMSLREFIEEGRNPAPQQAPGDNDEHDDDDTRPIA